MHFWLVPDGNVEVLAFYKNCNSRCPVPFLYHSPFETSLLNYFWEKFACAISRDSKTPDSRSKLSVTIAKLGRKLAPFKNSVTQRKILMTQYFSRSSIPSFHLRSESWKRGRHAIDLTPKGLQINLSFSLRPLLNVI